MAKNELAPIEFENHPEPVKKVLGIPFFELLRLGVSALLLLSALFFSADGYPRFILLLLSFLCSCYDVVLNALEAAVQKHTLDGGILIILASVLCFSTGFDVDGAAVMLIYCLTLKLLEYIDRRIRAAVLKDIVPAAASARLVTENDSEKYCDADRVAAGDTLVVEPGETVCTDCIVLDGYASLDVSAVPGMEGEINVEEGDFVPAGAVVLSSKLFLEAEVPSAECSVQKALAFTSEKDSARTQAGRVLSIYKKYYVPCALVLTAVFALLFILLGNSTLSNCIHRALSIAVLSGPCGALAALSLLYFCGLKSALSRGALIRGGTACDTLSKVSTVVFDKDGTVTTGEYAVESVFAPAFDASVLLKIAAHAAVNASSGKAKAILKKYGGSIDYSLISGFCEHEDGLSVTISGVPVLLGNASWLRDNDISMEGFESCRGDHTVFAAFGSHCAGAFLLTETVQQNAGETMEALAKAGVKETILLSGDGVEKTKSLVEAVGMDSYYSQCYPMDKLTRLHEICDANIGASAFVGSLFSDDSLFSTADLSIMLTRLGTGSPVGSDAGVIVLNGQIAPVGTAFATARRVKDTLRKGALVYGIPKILAMLLVLFGAVSSLWFAALVDLLASCAAVFFVSRAFDAK